MIVNDENMEMNLKFKLDFVHIIIREEGFYDFSI